MRPWQRASHVMCMAKCQGNANSDYWELSRKEMICPQCVVILCPKEEHAIHDDG
jgi:hypothetical protein